MINKYNNPRLHNTVLTGPGMTHPRNPHVVIGSDEQGFIQGDLMDANAIMETIDQKIDVDNIINDEKLNTAVTNVTNSILGDVSEALDTLEEVEDKVEQIDTTLDLKQDKFQIVNTSDTSLSAQISTYYNFTQTVDTLSVTLPTPSDTTHLSNIILFFTAGSAPALTITSDSTIVWQEDFVIDAGVSYEINCLFNGTKWVVAQMSIS